MAARASLVFAFLCFSAACGGAEKKTERPTAVGCPAGMVEVSGRGSAFCLDRTEVTVGSYLECVGRALCTAPGTGRDCNRDTLTTQLHPVNCVDARQGDTYCAAQGKRLPSEEEWEWAARGGKAGARDLGAGTCWSGGVLQHGTCAADRRGAEENALGLVDMAGNVGEWTSSGTEDARSVRGGAWTSTMPTELGAGARHVLTPGTRNPGVGFRCAKSF